jgi:Mannosyl-glycoprotein endo-beta-N-acetylglucosaminidase
MKFLKNNWFFIGLLLIGVTAVVRRNVSWWPGSAKTRDKTEKYTEVSASGGAESALGVLAANGDAVVVPAIDAATSGAFQKRFATVVHAEQKKFNLPAAMLLACAYVNSFAGTRDLAAEANNYFALACGPDWDGATALRGQQCFRRYNSPWESFRDFSIYLAAQDWIADARRRAGNDATIWAKVLAEHQLLPLSNGPAEFEKQFAAFMKGL